MTAAIITLQHLCDAGFGMLLEALENSTRTHTHFGIMFTQRRFDIQLAGALKMQLKRGNNKTRFGAS